MSYDTELAAFATAMHDDLARLLMAASRAVNARALAALDPMGTSGVRVAHLPVIAALDAGGSRIAELAVRIGHTRQSVAALVRDLARAGYVALEPDPSDGRATRVRLTATGADLCARATDVLASREVALRADLGDAAVDNVRAALRQLAGESDT